MSATPVEAPVAMLDAALAYARLGVRVIPNHVPVGAGCSCRNPLCEDQGKHPRIKEWQKAATTDEAQIHTWLQRWPDTNIGALTGRAGGRFVVDSDGEEGQRTLDDWHMEHGSLPETPIVRTGGGGLQIHFAYPAGMTISNSTKAIAPGIDIRGEGGQALLPPSRHRSGRSYERLDDTTAPAPAPAWLLEKIAAAEKRTGGRTIHTGSAGDDGGPIPEGQRNDALAAIAGRMRWAGLTIEEIIDALQRVNRERCQPPLPDDEIAAIAQSISRYPAGDGAEGKTLGRNGKTPRADAGPETNTSRRLPLSDFAANLESHKYIHRPTGKPWPRVSVNAAVPPVLTGKIDQKGNPVWIPASDWLDEHDPVHQMTWAPGDPEIIEGRILNQGGWVERADLRAYNLYRPSTIPSGDPTQARWWVDHVRRLYPDQADHIIQWFAHRVQRPAEKINHALLLGGQQGCGKDTILKPVREAIGPWNYADASPAQVVGRFNGFLKSVILLVPELCDLGDLNRYAFYEHMKPVIAAPPATLRCDEKFLAEIAVLNVCGVVFTSNQRIGIYLPAGDRRHFAAWSELEPSDLPDGYFEAFHRWLDDEQGCEHVAAYLRAFDLTGFNPNAPPPKTEWFWSIVDAGRAPEESELSTLLDHIEWPDAVTLNQLITAEFRRTGRSPDDSLGSRGDDFASWLKDRKNRRQIPHRMEAVGYVPIRNPTAKDGYWVVRGTRMPVYARQVLTAREQFAAANRLATAEGANR